MSISRVVGVAVLASLFLTLPALTQIKIKKIKRSALPPSVEKTVAAESRGATIRGFQEATGNGQTFYAVKLAVNGHSKDVAIDTNGQIVAVEEQVAVDSLSPAVKHGLQAEAGKGKLVKVESQTKRGKLVAYEAHVVTDGKTSVVHLGPDGATLDHEEWRQLSQQ
jgi:hypothetical protein